MKKIGILILALGCFLQMQAQEFVPIADVSPMDVSYFPENYPLLKIKDKAPDPLVARVIYSRPQKKDRELFGDLLPYGRLWRMGANEATEVEFYDNVSIGKTKVKKGRYTLYCIPNEDNWTVILNKDLDTWGSFAYNEKLDVVRLNVPVEKLPNVQEYFTMFFKQDNKNALLIAEWDHVKVSIPITL